MGDISDCRLVEWHHADFRMYTQLQKVLNKVVDDLAELKSKFDGHKHSYDPTLTVTGAITSTPVTGATSGVANGGTATTPILTLTK